VVLLAGELYLLGKDEDGAEPEWLLGVRKLWAGTNLGNFEPREDDLKDMELPCDAATYVLLAVSRRPEGMELPCGAATYVLLAVSRRPGLCHFQ
jgi:hypothetical protein